MGILKTVYWRMINIKIRKLFRITETFDLNNGEPVTNLRNICFLFSQNLGGWWLGWAPLVAIFATRISKGRTIKNVVEFGFILPILCNFIWFVVIGGVAIDMQNQAIDANLNCGMTE